MADEARALEDQLESVRNEKKLFFDTAYRSYTRLAQIADECPDEQTRRRILDAISELGLIVGRAEQREHPR